MGIKFDCSDCGRKLNVKSFLAGKRGICPHCGAKVNIPADPVPQVTSASPVPSPAVGAAAQLASPAVEAAPTQPAKTVPTVPITSPAPKSGVTRPMPASPAEGTVPAATVAPVPAPAAGAPDPITEAPGAVWYVRPSSGGQFGPATGDIMRKWMAEGRVNSDSLLWREGWPDWKPASTLFPHLAGGNSPLGAPPNPAMQLPGPSADSSVAPGHGIGGVSTNSYRTRPRKSNATAIAMVVVLTIASIGLLVALIAVIQFIQP